MNNNSFVDVFFGNGEISHPKPEGIAATWYFIKAQCGNTHPHAALPFGKMSCGLYTGGYPTGYGNHVPNSCGPVLKFKSFARGFAHMHQTGTGGIGAYYNYAVTAPVYGPLAPMRETVLSEEAEPGYYSATLESGIKAEFTVDGAVAVHRYHLEKDTTISIDISNDGLKRVFGDRFYRLAKDGRVEKNGDNAFAAAVTLQGIPTYFYAVCEGDIKRTYLWEDYKELSDNVIERSETPLRWGGAFEVGGDSVIKLGVSHKSIADAKKRVLAASDFDTARKNAADIWNDYLGRIEIDADDDVKELFYSNLYHSVLKPADFEDGLFTDFATLWDMYKTQLPLVYTLYAEESRRIVKTLLYEGERYRKVPTALMLWDDIHHFDGQAQLLSVYTVADAFYRGFVSAEKVIELAIRESEGDPDTLIKTLLDAEKYTHLLDLAEACGAAADIAKRSGNDTFAKKLAETAQKWTEAFDSGSGMLRESKKYYEGNSHNYSFRLLRDMEKRISVCGSTERFLEIADSFFGYGEEPVTQCEYSEDYEYIEELDLRRFDGINNEHDIEAPYVYIYAGRHDRTCEVVRGIQQYMFSKGSGGLPGNNDTGALTSWYVWNALGLFPVSGQDKVLISYPLVRSATVHLASGNTLKITVCGEGEKVKKAEFCGKELADFSLSVTDMMQGGELVIEKE